MYLFAIYTDPAGTISQWDTVCKADAGQATIDANFERCRRSLAGYIEEIRAKWVAVHGTQAAADAAFFDKYGATFGAPLETLRMMSETEIDQFWRAHYEAQPVKEITAERFHDLLECLPPLAWRGNALFESFCMSEYTTRDITQQVMRVRINGSDRYFTAERSINNRLTHDQLLECIK